MEAPVSDGRGRAVPGDADDVDEWRCPPCGAANDRSVPFCAACGSPQTTPTRWCPDDTAEVPGRPFQINLKGPGYPPDKPPPARQRGPVGLIVVAVVTLLVAGVFTTFALLDRSSPAPAAGPAGAFRATPTALVSVGSPVPLGAPPPGPSASSPAPSTRTTTPVRATSRTPGAPPPAPTRSTPGPPPITAVGVVDVRAVTTNPHVAVVGGLFDRYFTGIDAQHYAAVLALFDPAGSIDPGNPTQAATFTSGVSTTMDTGAALLAIVDDPAHAGDLDARLTFRSRQQSGYGPPTAPAETCTLWDITYELRPGGATGYRILQPSHYTDHSC